jgi:hypothetical protein
MDTEINDNDPVTKVRALYWKMKTDLHQLTLKHSKDESWREIDKKARQLTSISETMCQAATA